MKKKGFTLVELIAVMAITSVVILSVGGLYVTGIKKAQTTKINNDIENTYRNTYQLIKNQIEDSDKVISLKVDNNTKALGKEFKINEKPKELQGLTEDKAYILTKDSNSNIDTILASFRKNDSDELNLYILYMNNTNIDKNEIKQNKDILNLKNISRVREVCDNIEKINIDEADNGFNFKLDYLKNNIQRNYEFYISKNIDILTISNVPEKLVKFYDNIASLTVLNPKDKQKSIELISGSISLEDTEKHDNYPSFFIKGIKNIDGPIKEQFKSGINYTNSDSIFLSTNLRNNNNGDEKFQPLNLKFAKADKDVVITGIADNSNNQVNIINDKEENEINLKKIVEKLGKGNFVLINKDNKIQVNKKNELDIKDIDDYKISNFDDYVGVIMNIGDNKCTIIINGDLTIKSLQQEKLKFSNKSHPIFGMLIYSTGTLNIKGDTSVERTSFVVNNGINITGSLDIKGQYTLTGEKRNLISTFLNNGGN